MPEGDTIARAAKLLHSALAGKTVIRFETVLPKLARVDDQNPLAGRKVERVTSAGKHLLIHFSGDLTLRTHLRMNGSWHLYKTGQRWRKRHADMRVVIATDDHEAVGFNLPVAEFRSARELSRVPELRRMGPDLLAVPDPGNGTTQSCPTDLTGNPRVGHGCAVPNPVTEVLRRMRLHDAEEIADVLLNQRVLAGIGNIYKSEVLFACGVNPFTPVSALDDDRLRRIVSRGQAMLRQGVAGRTRFAVYGRGGEPCRRCGTRIEWRRQGQGARSTYWCPRCQR